MVVGSGRSLGWLGRSSHGGRDRTVESIVGLLLVVLLGLWILGLIRRIGGCLIHLLLLIAGLILAVYLLASVLGG